MSAADPLAFAAACLLRSGTAVHRFSCALSAAAALALLAPFGAVADRPVGLAVATVALGLAETWFALRVEFDARLFDRADRDGDWSAVDAGLAGLRLTPTERAGRPSPARIAGALRLMRWQAGAAGLQLAALAAAAAAAWF